MSSMRQSPPPTVRVLRFWSVPLLFWLLIAGVTIPVSLSLTKGFLHYGEISVDAGRQPLHPKILLSGLSASPARLSLDTDGAVLSSLTVVLTYAPQSLKVNTVALNPALCASSLPPAIDNQAGTVTVACGIDPASRTQQLAEIATLDYTLSQGKTAAAHIDPSRSRVEPANSQDSPVLLPVYSVSSPYP
ncbi:hypothetical protein KGQ71_03925 [Patescibacteria group bacterium]|nr:hypothetical protein [Patescibacteria group bacterium]